MTVEMSQSLWVRDRFLIRNLLRRGMGRPVAIPLGQGQVFNGCSMSATTHTFVAIPLGQGQVFNGADEETLNRLEVAIPLGQGQVFNKTAIYK